MSRTIQVPVTPSVLGWAISESGYDPDQIAAAVGVPATQIEKWIGGESTPNLTQARRLANKLHRPLAVLLLPSPPKNEPIRVEFRHSLQERREPNPSELRHLRRARRFQETLSWLVRELGIEKPSLPPRSLDNNPSQIAGITRQSLGVSITDQKRWANPSVAFDHWRTALEHTGVVVFLFSLGKDSCRGFSLWDELAPVIAINTAWNEPARTFTLFHEMAHLITRTSSACLELGHTASRSDPVERWCERFSAHVLMPATDVQATLTEFGWRPGTHITNLSLAGKIATVYKVSLRAATIRLIDLDAATWALYDQIPRVSDHKKAGGGGSGRDRTQIREDQFGERTTSLLAKAVELDVLDRSQAVELLDIPDARFDDFVPTQRRAE